VFNRLALRGFGGVLPWAQRALVDEERWLDAREYVELLSLAQVLPGPNICNLALMLGDRYFGLRGACAALAGILAAPIAIVMSLALLYAAFADQPPVQRALQGMGAVSAGLILAMALRLLPSLRGDRAAWAFVAAAFVLVGVFRLPLVWVMGGLGTASVVLARLRDGR
jgi:chromate transporter